MPILERINTRFNRVKNKGPALSDPEPIRSEPHVFDSEVVAQTRGGRRLIEGESKGFTLIELLVVIAILAILAAIGFTVFSGTQKKARISQRISDLKNIQTAIELYRSEHDLYPISKQWRSECDGGGNIPADDVIPGLVPKYLPIFPSDPKMNKGQTAGCYMYISKEDGSGYKIIDYNVREMTPEDYLGQRALIDPARDGGTDPCRADGSLPQAWGFFTYNACDL